MKEKIKKEIEIPAGVEVKINSTVAIKGPLGSVERSFTLEKVKLKQENNKVIVECKATKKEKKIANTIVAHIKNMIKGVINYFEYKLQICSTHFPMTVVVENKLLIIKNFMGERKDRIVKLPQDIEVSVKKDIITVKGNDIEKTAQCAANIEQATRITKKDRRVFEDGIFIIEKAGKKL